MNQIKIGKFIAECRKDKNLTQEQLAEMLNTTNKSVSKCENVFHFWMVRLINDLG